MPDTPEDRKRRRDYVMLGLSAWTDDEIARRADYTLHDVLAGQRLWNRVTAPAWRGMPSNNGFHWNPADQVYVNDKTRRVVPEAMTRRLLEQVKESVSHELEHLGSEVASGEIGAGMFRARFAEQLKELWIVETAVPMGGFTQLIEGGAESALWRRISSVAMGTADHAPGLLFQYDALSGFVDSLPDLSDEAIIYRAGLYTESAHGQSETARRSSHEAAGFNAERNILDANEDIQHCGECPRLSELGWMPLGTLPLPGLRECKMGCKCVMQHARLPESEIGGK